MGDVPYHNGFLPNKGRHVPKSALVKDQNRRKRPTKLSWFSYNQSPPENYDEELSLHPLKLEVQESPEEILSPQTETLWLSPNEEKELRLDEEGVEYYRESGGGGGRSKGRSKGLMGKGKSHHGGRGQSESGGEHGSGIINMDPDVRTHMLFPRRALEDDDTLMGGYGARGSGSPSFMKSVFGAGWGRRAASGSQQQQPVDPRFQITPELLDPFLRGAKQVSFIGDQDWQPEQRRPNSYNAEYSSRPQPPLVAANSSAAPPAASFKRQSSCDPSITMNGNGPPKDNRLRPPPSGVSRSSSMEPRPPGGAPPRTRMSRTPVSPEEMARKSRDEEALQAHQTYQRDCFIIPQESVERFLPDGISLPRNPSQLINVLEVDDPKLAIVFHMIAPLESLNPHLESPLADPMVLLRNLAKEDLERAKELQINEGFILKNLEANSEYPFINYYVIHKTRCEATTLFCEARKQAFDSFAPEKNGYSCDHTFDNYDEVATIARPPIEPISRKPITDTTGYIVCMYRVFKGDDGQKFERNWLYWTGARMLYKNLPRACGLRRITLHKTINLKQEVVYFLLVECSNFMEHIGEAANLLPILRARICGYTGIFRCMDSF